MSTEINYKWVVYCIEEAIDVSVWSTTEPTECPNIHGDRTIDTTRTRIGDSRNVKKNFFKVYPEVNKTTSNVYTLVATFEYGGSDNIGTIYSISVLVLTENKNTTFDIRVYDPSAMKVIAEKTALDNETVQIIDMGTISNIPTGRTTLEIHIRRTSGSKKINIKEAIVYYGQAFN